MFASPLEHVELIALLSYPLTRLEHPLSVGPEARGDHWYSTRASNAGCCKHTDIGPAVCQTSTAGGWYHPKALPLMITATGRWCILRGMLMSHGILRIWCSITLQGLLPFALTVNEHHCYSDETVLHITLSGMLDAPSSARCSLERESNFSWYLALSRLDFSLLIALARQQTLDLCFSLSFGLLQSRSAKNLAAYKPVQCLLLTEAGIQLPLHLVAPAPKLCIWVLFVALDESFDLLRQRGPFVISKDRGQLRAGQRQSTYLLAVWMSSNMKQWVHMTQPMRDVLATTPAMQKTSTKLPALVWCYTSTIDDDMQLCSKIEA